MYNHIYIQYTYIICRIYFQTGCQKHSETMSEQCVRVEITPSNLFFGKSLCNEAFWHWPIATRCFRQGCCYDHFLTLSDCLRLLIPIRPILLSTEVLWMSLGTPASQGIALATGGSLCPPRSFGVELWRVLVSGAGQARGCMENWLIDTELYMFFWEDFRRS